MKMSKIFKSPCKVNLHLDIGGKREDGFHSLVSIFHTVSLYDTIELIVDDENSYTTTIDMDGGPIVDSEKNLAWLASDLFFKLWGKRVPLHIKIKKNIPSGAGLGGGSSNGATVLLALNSMFGNPIDSDLLFRSSASIGSDVPFFLKQGAALVQGRGEIVRSISPLDNISIVIVLPDLGISTAEAYCLLDEFKGYSTLLGDCQQICQQWKKSPSEWSFFNSFQPLIQAKYVEIDNLINDFKTTNPDFVSLSGSGSAVFGLYSSEAAASQAFKQLKVNYSRIYNKKMIVKI